MKYNQFLSFFMVVAAMFAAGCHKPIQSAVANPPDCRPQKASVTVQCWSPYGGQLEQCEVVLESPPGCNFVEQAVKYSETLTLEPSLNSQRPGNWVMFEVARDDEGRIGRSSMKNDESKYINDPNIK